MLADSDPSLGTREIVRLTGVGESTIRQAVRSGVLPSINPGGQVRVRRSDVEAWRAGLGPHARLRAVSNVRERQADAFDVLADAGRRLLAARAEAERAEAAWREAMDRVEAVVAG